MSLRDVPETVASQKELRRRPKRFDRVQLWSLVSPGYFMEQSWAGSSFGMIMLIYPDGRAEYCANDGSKLAYMPCFALGKKNGMAVVRAGLRYFRGCLSFPVFLGEL